MSSSSIINPVNTNEFSVSQPCQVNSNSIVSTCNVSTQVEFEPVHSNQFLFFENSSVGTQITSLHSLSSNKFLGNLIIKSDKSCGPDSIYNSSCLSCDKFRGYYSIKNENALKDLTGTTFKVFDMLCSMIHEVCNSSIDKRNK